MKWNPNVLESSGLFCGFKLVPPATEWKLLAEEFWTAKKMDIKG